jgi:hypothetical protein
MVMRTLAFIVVRRVLGLIGLGPSPEAKDIEIAVLRHQLMVLQRQVARSRYAPSDRVILATLGSSCPAIAGGSSWSPRQPCCAGIGGWSAAGGLSSDSGGLEPAAVDLVLRLARESPRRATSASSASAERSASQ